MIRVLSDSNAIQKAQSALERQLIYSAEETPFERPIGNRAGHRQNELLYWNAELKFWASFVKRNLPRYYMNALGTEDPAQAKSPTTIVELNSPVEEVRRSVAGCFGFDEKGILYVLHRGKLGGKYVGYATMEKEYSGEWVNVDDGGIDRKMILVGALGSNEFPIRIKDFVYEIKRLKSEPK